MRDVAARSLNSTRKNVESISMRHVEFETAMAMFERSERATVGIYTDCLSKFKYSVGRLTYRVK
jgi:hypothetical protein